MNYRHAFHAGNFADLAKHVILTRLLGEITAAGPPVTVIDTHAGAGLYDLRAESSRRTGEAQIGAQRLMEAAAAPRAFDELRAAVRRCNAPGELRYYPGSPVLITAALRPGDRYIACELRPDDYAALKQVLPRESGSLAHRGDGWTHAARVAPRTPARLLVLVDPPFERGDDYEQAVGLIRRILPDNPSSVFAIWTPLKDLATFDAFLGDVEDVAAGRPVLAAEVRLRPLADPMRLNGCVMVLINAPAEIEAPARAAMEWIAATLGEAGALGRVTKYQMPDPSK